MIHQIRSRKSSSQIRGRASTGKAWGAIRSGGSPVSPEGKAALPLALRQKAIYTPVEAKGVMHGRRSVGSAAGNSRSPPPQDPGPRAAARLGDRRASAADLTGRPAGAAGIALSRPAPDGAPRMDRRPLGDLREQPPRQIL